MILWPYVDLPIPCGQLVTAGYLNIGDGPLLATCSFGALVSVLRVKRRLEQYISLLLRCSSTPFVATEV